jgi:hypothetical protein
MSHEILNRLVQTAIERVTTLHLDTEKFMATCAAQRAGKSFKINRLENCSFMLTA